VNLTNIDADAYSGWRKGKRMSFKNETLQMILNRLEKWYGQRIECDPQLAEYYRFTFTVHSEPLALILNYISHSAPLTYKMVGNNHYLIELKH
jgi:transmembrane sensor